MLAGHRRSLARMSQPHVQDHDHPLGLRVLLLNPPPVGGVPFTRTGRESS